MTDRNTVHVRDVMEPDYTAIDSMATISQALDTMQRTGAGCLIVEKRHEHDEYGLLLISDVARNVLAKDRAPERVNVYEIMAKPVISVDPEMDIRYCARLFARFDITRAPVIDGDKVLGFVSFTDLVVRGMRRLG